MGADHAKVSVERLKGIEVLFEDDLYQLGQPIPKGHDAVDVQTNCRGRTTLHGLAGQYACLFHGSKLTVADVERTIQDAGLPLSGTVEHAGDSGGAK